MIYTVGYSALITEWDNREQDIINKLREIITTYKTVIIDVRGSPHGLVGKPALMMQLGERYIHVYELGNPMYKSKYQDISFSHKNICLMCAEKNHLECHRSELAELFSEMRKESVIHLFSSAYDSNGNFTDSTRAMLEERKRMEEQKKLF